MNEIEPRRFQLVSRLGGSALTEAHLCRLQGVEGFEKEVVLKRIMPEHAIDSRLVRMFLDEARMVARLSHPNIVQILEVGQGVCGPYAAMEYVRGISLEFIVARAHRAGKVNYGHFSRIVAAICDALVCIHCAQDDNNPDTLHLVQRDLGPRNIVVSLEGVPKLIDFGTASVSGCSLHAGASGAAQEGRCGQVDHAADVFALGATLFELTTGRCPFGTDGDREAQGSDGQEAPARPSTFVPGYPPELEQIVMSALATRERPGGLSARKLRDQLEELADSPEHRSSPPALAAWLRELFPDLPSLSAWMISPPPPNAPQAVRTPSAPLLPSASVHGREGGAGTPAWPERAARWLAAVGLGGSARWKLIAVAAIGLAIGSFVPAALRRTTPAAPMPPRAAVSTPAGGERSGAAAVPTIREEPRAAAPPVTRDQWPAAGEPVSIGLPAAEGGNARPARRRKVTRPVDPQRGHRHASVVRRGAPGAGK